MNLPNTLTVSRMIVAPIFLVCLIWGGFWMRIAATTLFIGASVTDGIDGYIARSRGAVTDVGKLIDPLADKLLTSLAFIGLVLLGQVHSIPVIVIIGRDFLVTSLRGLAGDKGVVLAASKLAKWKTGLQMVAIIASLLFLDLEAWKAQNAMAPLSVKSVEHFHWFINGMVGLAAAMALISGVRYARASREAARS